MISVVIPAHNESARIGACLHSLLCQTYLPAEIIVVSNGSTDDTVAQARQACPWAKAMRFAQPLGPGMARNAGAEAARFPLLVFLDADSVAAPNMLAEFLAAVNRGCVGGTCDTWSLEKDWRGTLFWLYHNPYCRLFHHLTGVSFVRASIFRAVGGYDAGILAEDTRFYAKVRAHGPTTRLRSTRIYTSMRRFQREGYWKVTWRWLKSDLWPSKTRQDDFLAVRP